MKRRVALWIAWIGAVALLLLDLDFWRPQRPGLMFGWLPIELGYRVGIVLAAWLFMLFVCAWVWTGTEDSRPGARS